MVSEQGRDLLTTAIESNSTLIRHSDDYIGVFDRPGDEKRECACYARANANSIVGFPL
jgi:hypothetical protein